MRHLTARAVLLSLIFATPKTGLAADMVENGRFTEEIVTTVRDAPRDTRADIAITRCLGLFQLVLDRIPAARPVNEQRVDQFRTLALVRLDEIDAAKAAAPEHSPSERINIALRRYGQMLAEGVDLRLSCQADAVCAHDFDYCRGLVLGASRDEQAVPFIEWPRMLGQ